MKWMEIRKNVTGTNGDACRRERDRLALLTFREKQK